MSKADELWDKLQEDLLKSFPEENYPSNVQLIKDILTYKHIVHPVAVISSYFTIISGLTAESFYTEHQSSTTLYTISIAGTGTGKDMAVKLVPQIFDTISKKFTSTEIGYKVVTSKMTSVGALDNIFSDKRMIIYVLDEFGDALGKMQGGGHAGELTAKFKELYSQTNGTYKSIVYARSNKYSDEEVARDYPCFILSGLTTKEQLLTRLKRSMLHDGFLNRFVIMDGSDLKPYIDNDFENVANNKFEETIGFYDKVKGYINTPIQLSDDAKKYYKSIGSPYENGTDINKFCLENESEDFETNASTANRWRENALRLATAITSYEYGVNNSQEKINMFQRESFENRQELIKGSPLEDFNIDDPAGDIIKELTKKFGADDKTVKAMKTSSVDLNKMFAQGEENSIQNMMESLLGGGLPNIIDTNITMGSEEILSKALDRIFRDTDPNKKNDVLKRIMEDKTEKAQDRINDILNTQPTIITQPQNNTPFTPPVYVQKDILEWSYEFIKAQSIKFYEIFHTEVDQSQHTIKMHKVLKWFKDKHLDKNSWHSKSELLTKCHTYNKLCNAKERESIINELLDSKDIEYKTETTEGAHKATTYYRLKIKSET